ncbi:glycoside hydrolase family 16 protein [Goodfellowiella coeruleoviolacea]|uniref:Beta-glucanase, GH16 family n=1 Tax=Goodfellowiella coeruleoviolacea TaxID=334858 RepID=A0AAE3GB25_9PSEU|nr:glycoside hydrolase family 16 protein [Goodfellowiella coeruleoviolacea]MCP2165011.1 Beta-glucanase, GH16 family [Goodfellowiella coeruleoviolacea]
MRRFVRGLIAAAVLGAATVNAAPASAASTVTVDSLAVSVTAPVAGRQLTATAAVRASQALTVQALTIAVRDSAGENVDFPGAVEDFRLTTTASTFTTASRSFPVGTYTYFVAYLHNDVWTELTPRRTFTVTADPNNPVTLNHEFTGAAGKGPNEGLSTPLWFNDPCWQQGCTGTLAEYSMDNAKLDGNGHLVLTAQYTPNSTARCGATSCAYKSARLTMLDWENNDGAPHWSQRGGHLEARMRSSVGAGLWPAFWTVGANNATVPWPASGEIDIVEILGQHPTSVMQNIHTGPDEDSRVQFPAQPALPGAGTIDGWHTYAVDWDASATGYLKWSIDGVVTHTVTAAEAGANWARSFQHPHALILNLAVGSDDAEWVPRPDDNSIFPATLEVDWVRAHAKPQA